MLTAIARAFRTPDLRKKLLFTLAIMFLFRMGSHIPVPGVDTAAMDVRRFGPEFADPAHTLARVRSSYESYSDLLPVGS